MRKNIKLLVLLLLFTNIAFGNIFQPGTQSTTHCEDYQYLNQNVDATHYVATAMKANTDIVIDEVQIGGIATYDYDGNALEEAKFRVELVAKGATYEPTGTILKTLGEISDDDLIGDFTFSNLNTPVNAGTVLYLKYTPIVPTFNSANYLFMAKECWCDDGNCNENGDLQLGSHSDGVVDRVSQVWKNSDNNNNGQLGIYTNTYFQNLKITYHKPITMQSIPCQSSASMFSGLPTEMKLLNLKTGSMTNTTHSLNTTELNAVGYNKKDGFIWGVDQISANGTLIKIGLDNNGNYVSEKIKIANEAFESYIGDIDDNGHLFIKTGDKSTNEVIVIDLDPNSNNYLKKIKRFSLSNNIIIHDWAFNPIDDFLYAVEKKTNKLYKIDPDDGTVTSLGNTGINETQNIGAAFFDKDGNLYVYANQSGKIYKISVANSPTAILFSTTDIVKRNDGAMCTDIEISTPSFCGDGIVQMGSNSFNKLTPEMLGITQAGINLSGTNIDVSSSFNLDAGSILVSYSSVDVRNKDGNLLFNLQHEGDQNANWTVQYSSVHKLQLAHGGALMENKEDWFTSADNKLYTFKSQLKNGLSHSISGNTYRVKNSTNNKIWNSDFLWESNTVANTFTFEFHSSAPSNVGKGSAYSIFLETSTGGEECDDGNNVSGDGCSESCQIEGPTCGDGIVQVGEANFNKLTPQMLGITTAGVNLSGTDVDVSSSFNLDAGSILVSYSSVDVRNKDGNLLFNLQHEGDQNANWTVKYSSAHKLQLAHGGALMENKEDWFTSADNKLYTFKSQLKNGLSHSISGNTYRVKNSTNNKIWNSDFLWESNTVANTFTFEFHSSAPSNVGKGSAYSIFLETSTGGEECDDGNNISGDGCSESCQIELKHFTCTDTLFISNKKNLETNTDDGKMWLHSINRGTIPYNFSSIGDGYDGNSSGGYNAIGYNLQDNFIYGLDGNNLIKIDSEGNELNIGAVEGIDAGSQMYAGEFDRDGFYYVAGWNSYKIYKIDINQRKIVNTIDLHYSNTAPQNLMFSDIAIDETGEYFYAMLSKDRADKSDPANGELQNDKVVKIRISDGEMTVIGGDQSHLASSVSLVYSDIDGDVFMMNNESGYFKLNTETGELTQLFSTSYLAWYNDGTSCPDANITEPKSSGHFNIERTNSNNQPINTKERNAWYTQIVGRDFDYSLVFYKKDFSTEQNLTNVTLNVELVNMETNKTLYEYKFHLPANVNTSRIDISKEIADFFKTDLDKLPATKNARFRVTYGVDSKNNIMQGNCIDNPELCTYVATDYAKDNFAIRPESFYVKIADGDQERVNSREPNANLTMSAGYEYNLSVIATQYGDTSASMDYNRTINGLFDFNSTGMTHWEDNSSISETINIEDGLYNNPTFTHNNVGVYTILIPSDTNWTSIDQATNDCILNSSVTSQTPEEKSGCNIAQQTQPISLKFYPDHFKIDLSLNNLPNSGHDDFIYMSELNSTYNQTTIALQGKIIAQTEDNQTTTNFTVGCMATDVDLDLNASTLSVEGVNQQIKTIAGSNVNFTRYIQFNDDVNDRDIVNNLISLGGTLTLTKNKFLDENNGTATLDIRFNINKNPTEPINPVQVTFNGMSGLSADAKSTAHTIVDNYIPKGDKPFNAIRNFYYARVVSDLNNYPRVNMNISSIVRTPLNVDIYCSTTVSNYCATTKVLDHTNLAGTTREQIGWYLSSNHNGDLDGNVTSLVPNFNTVSINNDTNITLNNGSNGLIINTFINCNNPTIDVNINTTPALRFDPSAYTISCTNQDPSQWTGVGKTGNILSIKSKINKTGKMDW